MRFRDQQNEDEQETQRIEIAKENLPGRNDHAQQEEDRRETEDIEKGKKRPGSL